MTQFVLSRLTRGREAWCVYSWSFHREPQGARGDLVSVVFRSEAVNLWRFGLMERPPGEGFLWGGALCVEDWLWKLVFGRSPGWQNRIH
jgi:hypothetical protein